MIRAPTPTRGRRIQHRGGGEEGGGGRGIALAGPLAAVSVRVRGRPFSGGDIVKDADEGAFP